MNHLKALNPREKVLLCIILLTVGIGLFFYYDMPHGKEEQFPFEEGEAEVHEEVKDVSPSSSENGSTIVLVDVKGAVETPGVYEVHANGRVKDVIQKAGGFLKEADQTQLNLAGRVADEMMIYVPLLGETPVAINGNNDPSLISINSADLTELQQLPGIGPAKAEAIIQYREENGLFGAVEDLQNISGIGEKTFEKLKDFITVQ
ncbi:helix-hairpin-helix domain-containing protein [Guptibacillus hwajinpoensis]|uniref:helix-hairpin-helix domain-containing protein n=1 Tax=Guptibacillus hwajinpoensis TaxID=208199 RepID=UPI001CFE1F7A|nr:helix-hairpin-helix domain-containing protein [Pseudalkalibacillus hwajinpoensis]